MRLQHLKAILKAAASGAANSDGLTRHVDHSGALGAERIGRLVERFAWLPVGTLAITAPTLGHTRRRVRAAGCARVRFA